MTSLVILGAGGFARHVLALVDAINADRAAFKVLGFLEREPVNTPLIARTGYEVLGDDSLLASLDAEYLIGVGSPALRARLDHLATKLGRKAPIAVHPAAVLESRARLDAGVMVMAGGCVEADAVVHRHAYVNVNAVVGHDSRIGAHVTISPNAVIGGGSIIEDDVAIGANATIKQGRTVGHGSTVGANAMVARDVPPGSTVVGVPARVVKERISLGDVTTAP
jgi:sugar O-acyltransferase (sialic acid O-acetyltransferase NeuD family)